MIKEPDTTTGNITNGRATRQARKPRQSKTANDGQAQETIASQPVITADTRGATEVETAPPKRKPGRPKGSGKKTVTTATTTAAAAEAPATAKSQEPKSLILPKITQTKSAREPKSGPPTKGTAGGSETAGRAKGAADAPVVSAPALLRPAPDTLLARPAADTSSTRLAPSAQPSASRPSNAGNAPTSSTPTGSAGTQSPSSSFTPSTSANSASGAPTGQVGSTGYGSGTGGATGAGNTGGAGNQAGNQYSGGHRNAGGGGGGGNYGNNSNYGGGGGNYNQGNQGYAQRYRPFDRNQRERERIALEPPPGHTLADLENRSLDELQDMAKELDVSGFSRLKKQDLAFRILQAQTEQQGNIFKKGILEIMEDGFGFMRLSGGFLPSPEDIYVSQSQIRRFGLRTGDEVVGQVRPPKESEKYFSLLRVEAVNGQDAETAKKRPHFTDLTPVFPRQMFDLETTQQILSTRLLNLVAPIGRGQRGLIVSPPKAGKTVLLKAIANGIATNYGNEVHLMVALIGERPEEVTDMRRSVRGEVIASTFDEPVEDHTKVAEMTLERAKRLVEAGRDVVILLDSITRLARAYNLQMPPSGRTLSGDMDPIALYPPKAFFGAARNIEEGGSLTIISTCLVDTGSRMDDVVYEEFKGTGNMELHLDRKLSEKRVFPSIDIQKSGTRREELLMDEPTLKQVWTMRRMVGVLGGTEGLELMLARLAKTKDNNEFLSTLTRDVL